LKPITVNVETYLGLNKYEVDEGNPHIKVASNASPAEFGKLVRVCPAALYKVDGHGGQTFDFAGCLECGTCRIACGDTIIELWRYPGPTMGVEYRYG
jgi:ferredoxin-like protein FixX